MVGVAVGYVWGEPSGVVARVVRVWRAVGGVGGGVGGESSDGEKQF